MSLDLPISFPSEVSRLERQVEIERSWTPTQRLAAVADALAAAEALSLAGGRRAEQLEYHERCEQQWRQRMKEFIARHAEPSADR